MTDRAPLPDFVDHSLLDADQRVADDRPCVHCRYNLRTLAATGICPECGHSVIESVRCGELQYANVTWLQALADGTACLFLGAVGVPTTVVLSLICLVLAKSTGSARAFTSGFAAIEFLIGVLSALATSLGLILITRRNPRSQRGPEGLSLRRAVRILTLAATLLLLPAVVMEGAVLLVLLVLLGVLSVTVPMHVAMLTERIPDAELTGQIRALVVAEFAFFGLALLVVFLPAVADLGGVLPFSVPIVGVLGFILTILVARVLYRARWAMIEVQRAARQKQRGSPSTSSSLDRTEQAAR